MTLLPVIHGDIVQDYSTYTSAIQSQDQAQEYASSQRRKMITKLALGVLAAWGLLACSIGMTHARDSSTKTLGIILCVVTGIAALLTTIGFTDWGLQLRTINPAKYGLDDPSIANRIREALCTENLPRIASCYDDKLPHLKGSGLISKEDAKKIKTFIKEYRKLQNTQSNNEVEHLPEKWARFQRRLRRTPLSGNWLDSFTESDEDF